MEREHDPVAVETVGVFLHRSFHTQRGRALGRIALTRAILREPRFLYRPPVHPTGSARIGVPVPDDILDTVRHVADWIEADILRGAHWLSRTDAEGRPLKLAKIVSLAQARNEADKAMRRHLSTIPSVDLRDGHEEVELDLADGWKLVRLVSPEALDRESARMRHCVGNGVYDDRVRSGSVKILSLRDARGHPHATVEFEPRPGAGLIQMQGKGNTLLDDRYLLKLEPWLVGHAFQAGGSLDNVDDACLMVDVDQRIVFLEGPPVV